MNQYFSDTRKIEPTGRRQIRIGRFKPDQGVPRATAAPLDIFAVAVNGPSGVPLVR